MSPRRQEEPISYLKVETESITQGDNLDTFTPTRDSGHHYLDTSAGTCDHKMFQSPLSLEYIPQPRVCEYIDIYFLLFVYITDEHSASDAL